MNITAFLDVSPCSFIDVDRHVVITLMMEAICTSQTSVYFNDTTQHYTPEGCNIHTRCQENLESHKKHFGCSERTGNSQKAHVPVLY
jgi:hypothetical protein